MTYTRARSWLRAVTNVLGLHPAWLARAYAAATGESIQETVRRRRVEKALGLCRTTSLGLAEIAAEAGFCDQAHMCRSFQAVIGRTPLEARRESVALGCLPADRPPPGP